MASNLEAYARQAAADRKHGQVPETTDSDGSSDYAYDIKDNRHLKKTEGSEGFKEDKWTNIKDNKWTEDSEDNKWTEDSEVIQQGSWIARLKANGLCGWCGSRRTKAGGPYDEAGGPYDEAAVGGATTWPYGKGKGRGFKPGVFLIHHKDGCPIWHGECGSELTWSTPWGDEYERVDCVEILDRTTMQYIKCSMPSQPGEKGYGKFRLNQKK